VNKKIILSVSGLLAIVLLFWLGKTSAPKKEIPMSEQKSDIKSFDIQQFINSETEKLPLSAQNRNKLLLDSLQSAGDVSAQIRLHSALADFWKDSVKQADIFAFYLSQASKLDNSEKNLTFAAQIFLSELRHENDEAKLAWKSQMAIDLFEQAIKINPNNDTLRIGLGSSYVFGKGRSGDPQQTMKGIQELLGVVRRDSTNWDAQLVLGIGGYISGQYDKAILRLKKVAESQPQNLEAIAFLADAYAASGDAESAIEWYEKSKSIANDLEYTKEVDNRIKLLRQRK
jgi:tetratricopeptide (TPR) repeat protein